MHGRLVLSAAFVAAFLTGCGAAGPERGCTAVGARVGVSLEIEAPDAERVSKATMKVCWAGSCEKPDLTLHPDTRAEPVDCSDKEPDDACGATAVPTGGKRGFADIPDLPHEPVRVTVALYGESGKRVLREQVTVTPELTYPNGKECDERGSPQARLVVEKGKLRAA